MEFRIDRRRWLRNEKHNSALLRSDGRMCCLGFFGEALGIPDLLNKISPAVAPGPWPAWMFEEGRVSTRGLSADCCRLMATNDLEHYEEGREAEITRLFAQHGVTVVFEN